MTPQETLEAVRRLSENATLRPAEKRLRLARPQQRPPRRVIIAWEELHPPAIGTVSRPHQGHTTTARRPERVGFKGEKVQRDWLNEKAARASSVRQLTPEEFEQRCRERGITGDAA